MFFQRLNFDGLESSGLRGFAAPFSPGAGAYFGNDVMTTGGVTSHGLHHDLQGNHHTHTTHGPTHGTTHLSHGHHVANHQMPPAMPPAMPMGTHQHHGLAHQMGGPQSPPPPEPAPNVPPAQLPQVPSHVPTQNGSGPQVPFYGSFFRFFLVEDKNMVYVFCFFLFFF